MDATTEAAAVPSDDKDWTWVLERPCPECGLHAGEVDVLAVPDLVLANAAGFQLVLTAPNARRRPEPDVWSPLEYACHVRDVHRLYAERLAQMLTEVDPRFANWDQDETAVADRYGEQEPAVVSDELMAAATTIADALRAVAGDQWDRTGERSDGARFTVRTFAQYFFHDPYHHLYDVM
ncbi:MAG: DinB family protein [Ilumatobacteraceae bacterium]